MSRILDVFWGYIQKCDKLLWLMTLCASIYGFFLIYSMQRAADYNYLLTQLAAVGIGYVGAIIISVIDYKRICDLWFIPAFVSLVLLMLVFGVGLRVSGTDDTAWLRLPGGITFQPSELAKIAFIITFSKHLDYLCKNDKLKSFFGTISLFLHAGIPIIIIHMQGDDGSAIIFMLMFLIMAFCAGVQLRYFAVLFGGVAVLLPIIWNRFLNNEHRNRILSLFNTDESNLSDYAWQQYQAKVSIASGGLSGTGYYRGERVASYIVPEQENDFIFTVAGEELGFIGCAAILIILFGIMLKCLFDCSSSKDDLGKYICIGFFSLLFAQTIINIGMVLGLLPVIGITLPFFSSGGTSAMCLYLGFGLVQSVYIHNEDDNKIKIRIDKFSLVR